jgi:hypothetical protein
MLLLKGIQNSAIALGATYLGVAIGTDDTAENINQNALIAEAQRVASTNTISTTTVTNDTSEHEGDFTVSAVTLAVKEDPILNDATLQDARDLGLDTIADRVTTTGGGAEIGICMDNIPDDLRRAISQCTIIIAKGMANFESLYEMNNLPPVAYLLAAKCKPVAGELGVPVGSKIAVLQS